VITRIRSDELELEFVGPTEPAVLTPRLARALLRAMTNVEAKRRTNAEAIADTPLREALTS
jgi:hypothetical protein